jgi:hypothetical protein
MSSEPIVRLSGAATVIANDLHADNLHKGSHREQSRFALLDALCECKGGCKQGVKASQRHRASPIGTRAMLACKRRLVGSLVKQAI